MTLSLKRRFQRPVGNARVTCDARTERAICRNRIDQFGSVTRCALPRQHGQMRKGTRVEQAYNPADRSTTYVPLEFPRARRAISPQWRWRWNQVLPAHLGVCDPFERK